MLAPNRAASPQNDLAAPDRRRTPPTERHLIHDRDPLFTAEFLNILAETGVASVRIPPRSPNLNARAERFVRSIKESRLERMILFGEASVRKATAEFVAHHHLERNHQGLGNRLISPESLPGLSTGRRCTARASRRTTELLLPPSCLDGSIGRHRDNRRHASEDRDVADHSHSIVDPTLLHSNANAFSSRCVEQFLGCSHIRTIRASCRLWTPLKTRTAEPLFSLRAAPVFAPVPGLRHQIGL
jgi:hypothetical protein